MYQSLCEYGKAEEHQKKALVIAEEIGFKRGEAACYGNLGAIYQSLGEYREAEEYQRKALSITKEIGNKNGEALCYGHLGNLCRSLDKHPEAIENHEKALAISKEIGDICTEGWCHLELEYDAISEGNQPEIVSNLCASIDKSEKTRSFLGQNDQFKISFLDMHSSFYRLLSAMLCGTKNANEALYILEFGRARALSDLISGLHSTRQQTSVNPPSWAGIERIVKK